MKKIVLTIATVLLLGVTANAQSTQRDCNAILQDYFAVSKNNPDTYPADKAEWRCKFSANAFYLTNDVPNGSTTFLFSQLTNLVTGVHPSDSTVIDLNTFSFYTYNFHDFQAKDYYRTIYFELKGGPYRYLAVRSWGEMFGRTDYPEQYKD